MNRLTNEQRLQIIEFYYQNSCSVKRVHRALLPIYDEAHFWLNGYVNKQNCRIWSEDQPEALQELPMHPEKVTVWCGLWAGGIIGPYFFKDDNGRNVTVNGERYRAMITNFFLPKMEELDLADMWFQQDGATCHTARETMAQLRGEFGEQFISRLGPVNWPPRSCDLTPLDYFLWGHVKANVYRDKPATIDAVWHWKPILKHLFVRYRPICWRECAKIGPCAWAI